MRANAQRAVDYSLALINHAAKRAAEKRAELFAPPPLDPTDAVGAARDASIQSRYVAMPKEQRDQLHGAMARGENDAALHALLRDPLAMGPTAAIVRRTVWEPIVQRTRAEDVAKVELEAQDAHVALTSVGALQGLLEKHYGSLARAPRPTEDPTYMNA